MTRTDARELAFKTIYSKFFNNDDELDLLENADQKGLEFTKNILTNFASHYGEINEILNSNLKGYTADRVYKVDLAILIVAIIELKYIKNPKEVVINEAVNLSKKYSTEKSPKFINGVLADIVKAEGIESASIKTGDAKLDINENQKTNKNKKGGNK